MPVEPVDFCCDEDFRIQILSWNMFPVCEGFGTHGTTTIIGMFLHLEHFQCKEVFSQQNEEFFLCYIILLNVSMTTLID